MTRSQSDRMTTLDAGRGRPLGAAAESTKRVEDVLKGTSPWAVEQGEMLSRLRSLPNDSIDAVITDPPYSSGGQHHGDRIKPTGTKYLGGERSPKRPDFVGDNRDQRSFRYWSCMWLTECLRVAKTGAPICVFSDWRQLPSVTDAVQAGGWIWRGIVTWDKTEASRPRLGGFRTQSEFVVWGTKGSLIPRVGCLPGVFRARVCLNDKFHQTGKPTALMRELVKICPPGGIVLDPFAGSGTTLVAAIESGQRAIGVEWMAEYAEIARERCAAANNTEVDHVVA